MNSEILVLAGTAATLGFVHTLIGPDHYIPFIAMSRARRWSLPKTLLISSLAGLGHVLSSVILGFLGLALGIAVAKLEGAESVRGSVAAWLLIGFGFAYFVWGLRRAIRNKPHAHRHLHGDGDAHEHEHGHVSEHAHVHDGDRGPGLWPGIRFRRARPGSDNSGECAPAAGRKANITPWILFTIFVFGPCEPLIPLVMYPAAKHDLGGVLFVAAAFGLTTILTMLAIIAVSSYGLSFVRFGRYERYAHAMAGAMIFVSGLGVRLLGL
jgi:ABC-type nickel/cobalt efflux system permease component RcnA